MVATNTRGCKFHEWLRGPLEAGFFESWRKVPLSFCVLALSFKLYLYNCEADPLRCWKQSPFRLSGHQKETSYFPYFILVAICSSTSALSSLLSTWLKQPKKGSDMPLKLKQTENRKDPLIGFEVGWHKWTVVLWKYLKLRVWLDLQKEGWTTIGQLLYWLSDTFALIIPRNKFYHWCAHISSIVVVCHLILS